MQPEMGICKKTENKENSAAHAPKAPTVWFDKDGVLAAYDYDMYRPEHGCTAPWLTKNAHVYRHLPAYENMMTAFRNLYAKQLKLPEERIPQHIRLLTSVSDGITMAEQIMDSFAWIRDHVPEFRENDFYAVATKKQDVPVMLRCTISPWDILIDDFHKNLKAWKQAGGTAVKALNGINSSDGTLPCIHIMDTSEAIEAAIREIVDEVKAEKEPMTGIRNPI